jgi:dGTPase
MDIFEYDLTSELVNKFINGVQFEWNASAPAFSKVYFSADIFPLVETLKNYTYEKLINSSRLKVAEYRGYEIVKELFQALHDGGATLLPFDFKEWYDKAPNTAEQKRVICDFIAGMTDSYAIEFYGRLNSESPQSIFKPI